MSQVGNRLLGAAGLLLPTLCLFGAGAAGEPLGDVGHRVEVDVVQDHGHVVLGEHQVLLEVVGPEGIGVGLGG